MLKYLFVLTDHTGARFTCCQSENNNLRFGKVQFTRRKRYLHISLHGPDESSVLKLLHQ